MRETLGYINISVNPCRDFFAYVCSGVINNRLWPEDNTEAEFERMVFTGVMPPDAPRSPAGVFLIEYHRSCLESIMRKNFTSSLAVALVQKEQVVLKYMDAKKAFIYATRSILKYRLHAALYVLQQFNEPIIRVGIQLNCGEENSHSRDVLSASLIAINNVLPVPVTEERTLQLKANICSIYRVDHEGSVMYATANRSDFQRDIWNLEDLEAGLVANGLTLATVPLLTVRHSRTIRAVSRNIFSGTRSLDWCCLSPLAQRHAGWEDVQGPKRDKRPQHLFEVCKKQINRVWQLVLMVKVAIFTSPAKDAKLHVIFDNVKDAVRADLVKSGMVAADDQNRMEHFFRDLVLLTPREVVDTSAPVPEVSHDFASNLLEALAFDFDYTKAFFAHFNEKHLRSFIHLRINGNRSVYLNTNLYNFVKVGDAHLELSNMAYAGRVLAEALWFMVFRTVTWAPHTTANMLRIQECYDSFYWSNSSRMNPNDITSFFTALGLSSVLNAFYRPQWLIVKPAWGFGACRTASCSTSFLPTRAARERLQQLM
ncbi:hypothetical protein HPB51_002465 [Rhipicephalus microplus]|uniref:Uncharacterized protein n=1 Tax=Rhipicephalus microplus TaxID=6941 RepID=A0A9J6DEG9_RHIMP|nr:hypothetical protein HPB51_002465 [Rhipicephalus microplus]